MYPLALTIASLKKARLAGLMTLCAVLAAALAAAAVAAVTWTASRLVKLQPAWLDTLVNWMVGIIAGIGGWFMLPVLLVLIAGLFQETVIHRVELACYPDTIRGPEGPRFWADLSHDLRFTLWALLLNLLVLPLYFFGIGFFASVLLNSYLLGREFFVAAAGYHLGKPAALTLARRHRLAVYGNGLGITLLSLVPVVNLFMPIMATVWMVHVYHGLRSRVPP